MMAHRTPMVLILAGLLVSSGCDGLLGPYDVGSEKYLQLDEALERLPPNDDWNRKWRLEGLWDLWRQAPSEDKTTIEQEILAVSLDIGSTRLCEDALERLRGSATSEEIVRAAADAIDSMSKAEREDVMRFRMQSEFHKQERTQSMQASLKADRDRLLNEAGGSLRGKSLEEVNKLLDDWMQNNRQFDMTAENVFGNLFSDWREEYLEFFSTSDFYRTFGEPLKKQLFDGGGAIDAGMYYFYYTCRDGTVQIEVDAGWLSKKNVVFVSRWSVY